MDTHISKMPLKGEELQEANVAKAFAEEVLDHAKPADFFALPEVRAAFADDLHYAAFYYDSVLQVVFRSHPNLEGVIQINNGVMLRIHDWSQTKSEFLNIRIYSNGDVRAIIFGDHHDDLRNISAIEQCEKLFLFEPLQMYETQKVCFFNT